MDTLERAWSYIENAYGSNATEDVLYPPLLVVIILIGWFTRSTEDPAKKKRISLVLGVSTIFLFFGSSRTVQVSILLGVNYLIIRQTSKKYCHLLSLVFSFSWVVIMRFLEYNAKGGFVIIPGNAMLFILLRVVGLSFDVHLSHFPPAKNRINDVAVKKPFVPGAVDYLVYTTCVSGLLTGPYYRFHTFTDMLTRDWKLRNNRHHCSSQQRSAFFQFYKKQLTQLSLAAAIYFLTKLMRVDYQFMTSDAFTDGYGFPLKVFYLSLVFLAYRSRLIIAMKLGSISCVSWGIGCYPSEVSPVCGLGKTVDRDWDSVEQPDCLSFETINSVDYFTAETSIRMREAVRNWNKSIQWWFSYYIYRMVNVPSRFSRSVVTFVMSGLWHGIYPGYYFTLSTGPLTMAFQDCLDKYLLPHVGAKLTFLYEWILWFITFRACDYGSIGVTLLYFDKCFKTAKSCYFYGHLIPVLGCLFLTTYGKTKKARNIHSRVE